MSCGETCLYVAGKRYEDWPVDDPKGQDLPTVRRIVEDLNTPGPHPAGRVGAAPAAVHRPARQLRD